MHDCAHLNFTLLRTKSIEIDPHGELLNDTLLHCLTGSGFTLFQLIEWNTLFVQFSLWIAKKKLHKLAMHYFRFVSILSVGTLIHNTQEWCLNKITNCGNCVVEGVRQRKLLIWCDYHACLTNVSVWQSHLLG